MADIVFLADRKNRDYTSVLLPDTIVEIQHQLSNEITSYAIEKAQDGTFNAKPNNNIITMSGFFAEYSQYTVSGERITPVDDILEEDGDTRTRRKRAFDQLKKMRDEKLFVDVVTGLNVYNDCLIQNLSIVENVRTQDVLSFDITFNQPRLASVIQERNAIVVATKQDSATNTQYNKNSSKDETEAVFSIYDKFVDNIVDASSASTLTLP